MALSRARGRRPSLNPETWRRVDALFASALEIEESERAAFLDDACGSDAELRAEVNAMLDFARASEQFLEKPPDDAATMVLTGTDTTPRVSIDNARFIAGDIVAGRYRISALLGRGGMGEVYRAEDLKLGQPVALKFLAESLARDGAALARFHREVSLARQVSHRHVCRVYDIGEHAGMHFLSMEYVRGEELASLIKRVGRLPAEKAVEFARQLCAGLAAIHAAGVLHRDLKPANVMIDERGDVRITDFGIAALSDNAGGPEAIIGTPAYMSPEQLAGDELTPRSDVYALGLVLYEAFTGNRPFSANSLDEILRVHRGDTAPTRPSTWVAGVEPLVERLILRCLEKDPLRRPTSALQVAAALPGGDPLAAALAAGETPSPQMVAAAATKGGLRPLPALLLLVAIFGGIAAIALLSSRWSLHRFVPLDRPPELLRADALAFAREAGHAATFADVASGFMRDFGTVHYVDEHDKRPDRWQRMRNDALPAVQFWVRMSPRPLVPASVWRVTADDPPNDEPSMVRMRLDTSGRLLQFEAVPPREDVASAPRAVDWNRFFERAGLSASQFRETRPLRTPPISSDARFAWTGVHPRRPDLPLRVEAASYRGMPVYFSVIWPWQTEAPSDGGSDPVLLIILGLYFGAMAIAVILAWNNFRHGRGDRRGVFRLMLFVFVSRFVYWLFIAHHVATLDELVMFIEGLQAAVYWAAVVGLLYLALEPFVRRRWPAGLIGWSRLLTGDLHDPLVGRDILIGAAFGIATILSLHLFLLLPLHRLGANSSLLSTFGLDGVHGFFPLLITQISASIIFPLILTAVVVFLAMITRRLQIGVAVMWLILYAAFYFNFGNGSAAASAIALIGPTILMFVLHRYGLLSLVATFLFLHLYAFYPATTELTAWYATSFLLEVGVLGALVLFAFRVSLAGQKVLSGAFLDS